MNSKQVTIEKVGDGIGLELPKDLAKRAKLKLGSEVFVVLVDGILQITDAESSIAIPMMSSPGSRFVRQLVEED